MGGALRFCHCVVSVHCSIALAEFPLQDVEQASSQESALNTTIAALSAERRWYVVYTLSQHEKSVFKHLELNGIESFLPVFETVRVWKNRQRMKVVRPLFPNYVFVNISSKERVRVLQTSGVVQIVGNSREPTALTDSEIEFLRSGFRGQMLQPYCDLVVGERVRIKDGLLSGIEGILVRKNKSLRFVLTLQLINQHAAIEVDAQDLEPIGH
jgi:transcription antitermination factor NusG